MCTAATRTIRISSDFETRAYPWKYYIERTLWGEVKPSHWPGGRWFPPTALRSIAKAIHSYGWYWVNNRRPGVPSGADLDNTTRFQCFAAGVLVPFSWKVYVDQVLNRRMVSNSNPQQVLSAYHLGDEYCLSQTNCPKYENVVCGEGQSFTDPGYPAESVQVALGSAGVLSQLGVKAAVERCGATDWISILGYYYRARPGSPGGHVLLGRPADVPPVPKVSHLPSFGQISFSFPSRFTNGVGAGWRYGLEKFIGGGYRLQKLMAFDWRERRIPTATTLPWAGECSSYRVRAWNPYGWSHYAYFNGGAPICG